MHEWRSHTAEVELVIATDTQANVFIEAAAAFGELVALEAGGDAAEHEVTSEAADRGALLVEWLEELIFLAETESFVPEGARDLRLDGTHLRATVVGRRAPVEPIVKAATYHGLRFEETDDKWCARVVLDV